MERQMLRPATLSALLATMAGLIVACGPAAGSPTPAPTAVAEATIAPTAEPTPSPPEKIVLRVGTGDSGDGLAPHEAIIERFEAANPDIEVQLEPVVGNDYYALVLAQIASGSPPDLLQIGDDAVPQFVREGALVDLTPFIQSSAYPLDTSIYLPGMLAPGQWEGAQYLLPKDFSPLAIYYNKRLFDEFGVAYPEAGWTWEEFLAAAEALTQDTDGDGATDVWGVQLPGPWTTGFEYWVAAAGGRLISEDGTTFAGYLDSPETARAVQFYGDLYNKHRVAPPPVDLDSFAGGNNEFEEGRAAMRLFGRWPQASLRQDPDLDLGVAPPPAGPERANVLFWGGFGISTLSDHQEAAWRFLRFYVGPEGAEVWKDWGLPTVAAVAEASGQTTDPIEGVWIEELNHLAPRAYVATPFWGATAEPALRRVLEQVLIDPNADVGEALKLAAAEAQQALDSQK